MRPSPTPAPTWPTFSLWIRGQRIETGKGTLISGATDLSHLLTQSSSSEDNSITVVLGAHNIRVKESTQQVIPVRTPIPHPKYNSTTRVNDIMLLQCGIFTCPRAMKMATARLSLQSRDHGYIRIPVLCLQLEDKAKLNCAVRIIGLPGRRDEVEPGMVCSVAGWGRLGVNTRGPAKLHEVELEIQRD
ncbi:duodenase-1-like isoform X3 [Rhinolophus sinicus]|uniref:duodenase-1-like isoform X3 n=1 Tax=Rhinolophus sinicus TaxID=89399 RepID=UPI003D79CEB0